MNFFQNFSQTVAKFPGRIVSLEFSNVADPPDVVADPVSSLHSSRLVCVYLFPRIRRSLLASNSHGETEFIDVIRKGFDYFSAAYVSATEFKTVQRFSGGSGPLAHPGDRILRLSINPLEIPRLFNVTRLHCWF
jgi:hypothetical protein